MKVIKRDGSLEDFSREKIIKVVSAAGLDFVKAQKLALQIEKKILLKKQEFISSSQIKDLILLGLNRIDKSTADLFRWYQKIKDRDLQNQK